MSSYQGSAVDWPTAKNNGIVFAWAKATEGLTVNDADFSINMANAKSAGVLIGAYHFAHPELHAPSDEVTHFWGIAGNYIANGGSYLQPMLDYEVFTGMVGATSDTDWANQWFTGISNNAAAKGVTVKPLIYVSACNACNYDSGAAGWIPWIASYNGQSAQTGTPWNTCTSCEKWGSGTWTLWQYTDSAPLANAAQNADGDVFNGTMAQLLASKLIIGGGSIITSQPSSRYADRGSSITMRVVLANPTGATYQWKFNGTAISGQTKSTLTLSNIQSTNAGSYTVVIGGTPGTATSSNAVLTVFQPYTTVFADNFDVNSSANWMINMSSSDNRATFGWDYSAIGIPSAPNSTGGTTKGLRMDANISAGAVAALSVSPKNQAFGGPSSVYRLHFDMWMNVIGPLLGPATGGGTGSTEALTCGVGTAGNRVEWNGTGSTADGVYFFVDGDGDVADASTTFGDFGVYTGAAFQGTASGVYAAGNQSTADQTSDSYYQNVFPGGQSAPTYQQTTYPSQQTGTLAAGTVGLGWHDVIVEKTNTLVNWYIDGLRIASVSSSLGASNVFVGYWDPFASVAGSTNLSFGLVDNLRVEVPAVAPVLTRQPSSQTVAQTSNITFSATATGVPLPSYQWRFNGIAISNATDFSYTVVNAQTTNAGSYSVIVTNVAGTATSTNAVLKVIVPPALTSQPSSQTINVGANTTLLLTCTGTQPLQFIWSKDGNVLPTATDDRIIINNAQLSDAGFYIGTVTNSAGAASTSNTVVTVVQMQTSSSGFTSDGLFQLTISGAPGPGYTIDGSTNLIDWFNIALLTNVDGTIQFTDANSTNYPQLFYRVSAPSN